MIGDVYGEGGQVTRETAANTVLRDDRYPYGRLLATDRYLVEIA